MTVTVKPGSTICFVGDTSLKRSRLRELAIMAGMKIVSKLSGTVTVVLGAQVDNTAPIPPMLQLAARNELPILGEFAFVEQCQQLVENGRRLAAHGESFHQVSAQFAGAFTACGAYPCAL